MSEEHTVLIEADELGSVSEVGTFLILLSRTYNRAVALNKIMADYDDRDDLLAMLKKLNENGARIDDFSKLGLKCVNFNSPGSWEIIVTDTAAIMTIIQFVSFAIDKMRNTDAPDKARLIRKDMRDTITLIDDLYKAGFSGDDEIMANVNKVLEKQSEQLLECIGKGHIRRISLRKPKD
jgi:hypothetical protein